NGEAIFEILPDNGYTIQQVSTDTNLHFQPINLLKFTTATNYWIRYKLSNTSNYDENYVIALSPTIQNNYFQYDSVQQKWLSQQSGYAVVGKYYYGIPSSNFTIRRNETQVNYIFCKAEEIKKHIDSFKSVLYIVSEKSIAKNKQLPFYAWIITIALLLLFLLYNIYLYIFLKDKTYLYFLLLQFGAIIYVTSAFHFVGYLIETPFYSMFVSGGKLSFFEKNSFANRIGAIIVVGSFVQLTRHFLSTQQKIPKVDKTLKILWWFYLSIMISVLVGMLSHFNMPKYYSEIENCCLLVLLAYIYYTTWYSYRRNYKPAFYLLIANLIPLSVIVLLVFSLLVFKTFVGFVQILPAIAAVSQAITFAIALHLRLKNLQRNFILQQDEAINLKQQIENLEERQKSLARENEKISAEIVLEKNKNEEMLQKLEANQREMASNTMYMYQKNSLLNYLKVQIKELNKTLPESAKQASKNIDASLQNHQFVEADWDRFKLHFENVHPSFFEDLKNKYPDLTKNETRLCAYLHLNMSTKEIAALLNIDPGSVRRAKTRLNKKMNLSVENED
ncbi:MAG: 7TM diverse intracellular signaling domain-containing protein, partial [Dolichospermum sp.]